tara:strand:+ start:1128 stop:1793 length:666 start_codon:yes stop_codon:yes gene_type:complete
LEEGFGSLPFLPTKDMITSSDLGIAITTGFGKLRLSTPPSLTPVSVAEAKVHLRIDSSFTDDDTYIGTLIDVATLAAENFTNLAIMEQTFVLDIDAFPDYFNLLKGTLRTLTINSITYKDENNASQTLAASNYVGDGSIKPARVYYTPDASIPSTFEIPNAVNVNFTLGFTAASQVPAPIKQAVLLMVGTYYETRQTVSDRTFKEIPQSAEYLLLPYRVQG